MKRTVEFVDERMYRQIVEGGYLYGCVPRKYEIKKGDYLIVHSDDWEQSSVKAQVTSVSRALSNIHSDRVNFGVVGEQEKGIEMERTNLIRNANMYNLIKNGIRKWDFARYVPTIEQGDIFEIAAHGKAPIKIRITSTFDKSDKSTFSWFEIIGEEKQESKCLQEIFDEYVIEESKKRPVEEVLKERAAFHKGYWKGFEEGNVLHSENG